ncbi:hypothetical protein JW926_11945, partial [Candidatus Sumerlaeota bacterium]|nr:hypothetical protein [Candidatus Sumerlaeota bacterium]
MYGNYEKSFKGILVIFCMFLVFTCSIQAQEKKEPKQTPLPVIMVNPEIDNVEPFGYLAKPATCLSVIGAPDGTQVCFDGSLYTASSELVFFYGEPLKPIMARAKTLLEGWIPVIRYSVQDGDVEYRIEAFASMLTPGDLLSPMINFVRVEMENKGKKEVKAVFAAGTRFTGEDHRFRYRKPDSFSPAWMYEMTEGELIRDGKMILCYPKGGERLATPDAPYKSRFKGSEFFITDRAEVGLVKYAPTLSPGKKYSLIFKHPFLAVPVSEKENIETVK